MATLNPGIEKPLGLFCFGCFRLQNAVSSYDMIHISKLIIVDQNDTLQQEGFKILKMLENSGSVRILN